MRDCKIIFVTGGVLSGLGKGVVSASIAKILQDDGKRNVIPIKCDGYLNVDPGTMNPVEHGEVFVLDDGTEADLDFGHYERFLGISCTKDFSLTSGKVLSLMIEKERKGEFLGKTVQVIPHLTGIIREHWEMVADKYEADVLMIEIGGTVGDIENLWFLEAAREMLQRREDDVFFVHLGYVPEIGVSNQQKTKPFQQSLQLLRERGIFPNVLVARGKNPLKEKTKKKLHWLCMVPEEAIFSSPDLEYIYELPLKFIEEGMGDYLKKELGFDSVGDLESWEKTVNLVKGPDFPKNKSLPTRDEKFPLKIAICGKYVSLDDSYISIMEALDRAVKEVDHRAWIWPYFFDSEILKKGNMVLGDLDDKIQNCHGIIVPGGFGERGVEGKINAIEICRENNIPFLGICYGLQLAVVEFARNVCGLKEANTVEIDPDTKEPVIHIMEDQKDVKNMGGTMRLGSYPASLKEGTLVKSVYGKQEITERHRHRYEVNQEYCRILEENGLVISGTSPDGKLVEFIEYPNNDFFVGTQAHPELKSTFEKPSPLFVGFLEGAKKRHEFFKSCGAY